MITLKSKTVISVLMQKLGFEVDPWQAEVLGGEQHWLLVNCARQVGKSTVAAILSLLEAMSKPETTVLLVSPGHRRSHQLFWQMRGIYDRMGMPALKGWSSERLTLYNNSRIVGVVGAEDVVGATNVRLVVIDEAARVSVDVYRAVVPMLALTGGRIVCLSTPCGKRGFFYEAWVKGGSDWERIEVPGERVVPFRRGYRHFLEMERGERDGGWFRREYCCSFEEVNE